MTLHFYTKEKYSSFISLGTKSVGAIEEELERRERRLRAGFAIFASVLAFILLRSESVGV